MNDFLTFRRMLTPVILSALQGLLVAACLLTGLVGVARGEGMQGFAVAFLGPLVVRILLEGVAVVFSINETLTDIKNQLKR